MFYNAKEKLLEIQDIQMNYITFGKGEKPLILIQGLSTRSIKGAAFSVAYMYRMFARDYKVYLFDRRENISDSITVRNLATDIAMAMDTLKITNADIFGVSQGGMIAQLFAIKYPQKLTSLVLALTLSRNNDISRETIGGWIEMAENGEMAKLNKDSMCKTFSSPMLKKLYVINKLFLKTVSVEKQERFVRLAKSILEFDCHKSLDKITCPTLVLGAKKDLVLGVDGARELADGIPNASYYEFGKQGHAAFIESKQFNKMILEFLRENT